MGSEMCIRDRPETPLGDMRTPDTRMSAASGVATAEVILAAVGGGSALALLTLLGASCIRRAWGWGRLSVSKTSHAAPHRQ